MRNKPFKKRYVVIVVIIVFLFYGFIIVDRNIRPTILAISEVKARMVATQAINDAVKEKIGREIQYRDLIFLKYDNEGKLTLMQANTILMTNIASDVALGVQDQIRQTGINKVKIPLGNAFGSEILSQYGPKINMEMVPQGSVTVDFATEFQESGINQTIHRVYLIIKADVRIIVPLASDTASITTTIPIAETVIVGDVPDSYINVPKEDFLNVVD
ncbi:sporulation protein YunB [Clostridium sp. D2Q-11]|uniref:Sporulation protein YunB n=1 Tax=Anaeromonas frigoriresistens TaxID=2683708 RepID=A0A942UV23_9FIRM|nr:sporulation protein YunB [Anaeromonas frigoriresistens]MBS4539628.1 sporulation protein YunB [Anaeromonas frigoriresistens]